MRTRTAAPHAECTTEPAGYTTTPTKHVDGHNGVTYAYRQVGPDGGRPLVLLQHFRGNLDGWDPALVDTLAADRGVITFDNVGVGGTTGSTPSAIADMAQDAGATVVGLMDEFGFDPLEIGPLARGWQVQPGTPAYIPRFTRQELTVKIGEAKRHGSAVDNQS